MTLSCQTEETRYSAARMIFSKFFKDNTSGPVFIDISVSATHFGMQKNFRSSHLSKNAIIQIDNKNHDIVFNEISSEKTVFTSNVYANPHAYHNYNPYGNAWTPTQNKNILRGRIILTPGLTELLSNSGSVTIRAYDGDAPVTILFDKNDIMNINKFILFKPDPAVTYPGLNDDMKNSQIEED